MSGDAFVTSGVGYVSICVAFVTSGDAYVSAGVASRILELAL